MIMCSRPVSGETQDMRRTLTTKSDHNRIRHSPIPADAPWQQPQVSDHIRQPGPILQAGGRGSESP
jgi:hypothetical protein